MTTGHFAYFEKDGKVEKAPLIKWASYRRRGFSFSTVAAFNAQEHSTAEEVAEEVVELPTMENTKEEILAYAEANEIEVDEGDVKADLLAAIELALEG